MSAFRFLVVFALVAVGPGLAQGKTDEVKRLKEQLEREVERREWAEAQARELGKLVSGREDPLPKAEHYRLTQLAEAHGVVAAAVEELLKAKDLLRHDPRVVDDLSKLAERGKRPYDHFSQLVGDLTTVAKAAEGVARKQAEELKLARESLEKAVDRIREEGNHWRGEMEELRKRLDHAEDEWITAERRLDSAKRDWEREKEELLRQLDRGKGGGAKPEGDDMGEAAPLPPRPRTEAEIKEHLANERMDVVFDDALFEDTFEFLYVVGQVSVVVDPAVGLGFKVSLVGKDMPLGEVIERTLSASKAKLGFTIWCGTIYVHAADQKLPAATAPGESPLGKKLTTETCVGDFFETPLAEALDFLSEECGFDVEVDAAAKERVGEVQVSLLADLPRASMLDLLTLRHGLRWKVAGDAVRIELAPKK